MNLFCLLFIYWGYCVRFYQVFITGRCSLLMIYKSSVLINNLRIFNRSLLQQQAINKEKSHVI